MLQALFGSHSAMATHRGWPLVTAEADSWRGIGEALREGKLDLLALWGDADAVQCTLYEPSTRQPLSVRLPVCAVSCTGISPGTGDHGSVRHRDRGAA